MLISAINTKGIFTEVDKNMELWDVYNKDRIKTGNHMIRGDAFADGAYHLIVHACIFNSKNEMLIQQRQSFKEGWPNLWDFTVGGSAIVGDSSCSAIKRELFEEIGYEIDFSNVRPHFTINFTEGFDDYYLIEADVEIEKLNLQYEEVQGVKWASKNEIFCMIDNGRFIPYYKSLVELCFDMKTSYSARSH